MQQSIRSWLFPVLLLSAAFFNAGCTCVRRVADQYGSPEFIYQTTYGGPALIVTILTALGAVSSISGEKKSGFLFIICLVFFFLA